MEFFLNTRINILGIWLIKIYNVYLIKLKIKTMKPKEIREILMTKEVKFTVKGITEYGQKENGYFGEIPKVLKTMKGCEPDEMVSIWSEYTFQGMNVRKFGPTCVTLFTYDMLGKKIVGKIKYEDVTIIKEKE